MYFYKIFLEKIKKYSIIYLIKYNLVKEINFEIKIYKIREF